MRMHEVVVSAQGFCKDDAAVHTESTTQSIASAMALIKKERSQGVRFHSTTRPDLKSPIHCSPEYLFYHRLLLATRDS
jgi:hypothetical protein